MDRKSVKVFIPDREECYERLRRARFGATVACLYCGSEDVIKKGTTGKDAQKYRCKECDSWFNDLTGTLFEHHKFPGTKTKLQLVQRMGRILRKHQGQEPHFHHFVAVPDEHYIEGLDSREYVQEVNWVRELGELIQKQPEFDEAAVDSDVIRHAEQRGHEQWARDLLDKLDVETVQGSVNLKQIIQSLTPDAASMIRSRISFTENEVDEEEWNRSMDMLRDRDQEFGVSVTDRQRIWWLFPVYRNRPSELQSILEEVADRDCSS